MSAPAARAAPRPVRPRMRFFLQVAFVVSLLALGFAGYFIGTLYYASVVDERIVKGMDKRAVDGVCWLGTQRETPLAKTAWAATTELPEGYARIVVYRIGGFHPIEVVYSSDRKVMLTLPAYE